MRDLTKSIFSFSWAMSLFGIQQALNLVNLPQATKAFDEVTEAAEAEFGGLLKAGFKAGDTLQRSFVDLSMGVFSGQPLNPDKLLKVTTDAVRQSAAVVQQGITTPQNPPAQSPVSARQTGWGPTPQAPVTQRPVTQTKEGNGNGQRARSGWGPMASSTAQPTPGPGRQTEPQFPTEPDISPDYPFESHFVEVLGSRMHYIDVGTGGTILFLHGNPTWSYLWRNVIPHLQSLGRCIAPDLIGFGLSGKPKIEYRWFDHAKYLEAFIERMGLRNITLVLHDQGSGLGFNYAMNNESNVRAIAFFEAIVKPYPWEEFSTPEFREIFRKFRTGGIGGEGWQMIVEQNFFIEQLLPQSAGRALTEEEMTYYRAPFKDPQSRLPIWRFPRETPIGGEPLDVWKAVSEYSRRLQNSSLPKLMLYAEPGGLLTKENVDWVKQRMKNLKSVNIGPGLHFLQESSPHRIGREVADWYRSLS